MQSRELYTQELSKYIDKPIIKVITGIRRSGKSFLLKLLKDKLISQGIRDDQIIYINYESLSYDDYRDYSSLYSYVKNKIKDHQSRSYLLIDEIQEVSQWEKAIRSFSVDFDCDIYITGSNANLLSGELATYLSGRYVSFQLFTLSFQEYINFNSIPNKKDEIKEGFVNFIKYGGFPGLIHMDNDQETQFKYLDGIYNTIILKDVIQRNNIRDPELLNRILLFIMDNIGQLFSAKNISGYLISQGRKTSTKTIYKFLNSLEDAFVIHSAKRYDVKGKRILQKTEKIFLSDLGLRHAILGYREMDIAQIIENVVYLELLRRNYKVYVGREGKYEIDFIALKNKRKVYIQVTYLLASKRTIEREFRPLKNIKDNFPKYVLSMDDIHQEDKEGIKWMNIIDFLLGEDF